jgi:CheY-like chemotaxis protein
LDSLRKVLVIDDELPVRRVVEFKLRTAGYQVISAADGIGGMERIITDRPDAVVSDIVMPGMDGRQLCVRSNVLKKRRPFLTVIMTCRISPDEQEWLSRMTDTVLLEKPFSPAKLLECIDSYFGIKR